MSVLLKITKKIATTKCLVLHPVGWPNKGPIIQQYLAQQAIGLASSLNWKIIQGPFNKNSSENKKYQGRQFMIETSLSQIRDGSYIKTSFGNGIYYNNGVIFDADQSQTDGNLYKQWRNKEIRESLANSSLIKTKRIIQKAYFTKGKLQIISKYIMNNPVDCLFVNCQLKPSQFRNIRKIIQAYINSLPMPKGYNSFGENNNSQTQLESEDNNTSLNSNRNNSEYKTIRIFDRFTIILQIFAKRASNNLSKLQIQLSYLNYIKTKLVRQGSTYSSSLNIFNWDLMKAQQFNLEIISAKQRRAARIMSGQGQSQLQLQRRDIKVKIANIKKSILEQRQQRNKAQEKQKKRIEQNNIPIIAIVGYTNVGKSALMNAILKKKEVQSEDMLFQTLRTTSRQFNLPSGSKAILLDTIGFITNLPSQLFESFKITLEQINNADIIIQLQDISHPQIHYQNQTILEILNSIDAGKNWIKNNRIINVWNKVDLLNKEQIKKFNAQYQHNQNLNLQNKTNDGIKQPNQKPIKISAIKGIGIAELLNSIQQKVKTIKNTQKYYFEYQGKKHQKIIKWLKLNTNLSYQIPIQFNQQRTIKFPQGSIRIQLELDQVSYSKFSKFLNLENEEKVIKKINKGMPPSTGW